MLGNLVVHDGLNEGNPVTRGAPFPVRGDNGDVANIGQGNGQRLQSG